MTGIDKHRYRNLYKGVQPHQRLRPTSGCFQRARDAGGCCNKHAVVSRSLSLVTTIIPYSNVLRQKV